MSVLKNSNKLIHTFALFRNSLNSVSLISSNHCIALRNSSINSTYYATPPPDFRNIELPEQRKLTVIPKIPQYYINMKPPQLRASHNSDLRGPERVNNTLLHKQYGIIALSAGYLKYGSIEVIRNTVNREMDTRRMFAIWRVDPLWKPVTKKAIGKRMGGGKGNVHHYVTPVKAGRIVIEVGGRAEYEEVYPFLNRVAIKMPFDAIPISQEILENIEKEANDLNERNINPFSFKHAIENDIQGCGKWIGPWDRVHFGDYI